MSEWSFAQSDPNEKLAKLHFFCMKKKQDGEEIEFGIVVKEYITPSEKQDYLGIIKRNGKRLHLET